MAHTFALPVEEALALLEEEIAVLTEVITMTRSSVTAASEFVACMEEAAQNRPAAVGRVGFPYPPSIPPPSVVLGPQTLNLKKLPLVGGIRWNSKYYAMRASFRSRPGIELYLFRKNQQLLARYSAASSTLSFSSPFLSRI